MSNFVYSQ